MLQESYPPDLTILKKYVPVWALSGQNGLFLYESIVHTYYRAVQESMYFYTSRQYLVFHVHGMNQDETFTAKSMICIYHVSIWQMQKNVKPGFESSTICMQYANLVSHYDHHTTEHLI